MTTTYPWPQGRGWYPSRFEMRVMPNIRSFTSPYTKGVQALDLLGERWRIIMDLPPDVDGILGAAREAFSDRLRGPVNLISIGHQRLRVPHGTMRDDATVAGWVNNVGAAATWRNAISAVAPWSAGAPALRYAIAQLANIAVIQSVPGATLRAGDMLGIGQLVRVMADAGPASSDGLLAVEFTPRARQAIPAYTAVQWNYPTASFRLVGDGVPTQWQPGAFDGASIELIEDI